VTHEKGNGKIQLLICDGHESYITPDFIIHCMFHNIVLLILPPHTSHITQPLDVGIFSALKKHMVAQLHGLITTEIAQLQKFEWLSAYARARKKAFHKANILSAYLGAGLFPFCPNIVLRQIPTMPLTPHPPQDQTPRCGTSNFPLEHPFCNTTGLLEYTAP
jgi:DDE superfamily endonuclease